MKHIGCKTTTLILFLSLIALGVETAAAQAIQTNRWYRISVPDSKLSIDVPKSSKTNGEKLMMFNYFGTPNQMFRFSPADDGHFYIINKNSDMALAVLDASRRERVPIVQATIGTRNNDQFKIIKLRNNRFAMTAKHSRKPICISNTSLIQGNRLTQFEFKEVGIIPQNTITRLLAKDKKTAREKANLAKYPGGTIRVLCEAGYVATFTATWTDSNNKPQKWSSGRLSAGRRVSKKIPPLSRNVSLKAVMHSLKDSGIFYVKNVDFRKEYKVYGTVFKPKWTTTQ